MKQKEMKSGPMQWPPTTTETINEVIFDKPRVIDVKLIVNGKEWKGQEATEEPTGQRRTHFDTCVCCGEPVPEGRQVCPACELYGHGYQYHPRKPGLPERIRVAWRVLCGRKKT